MATTMNNENRHEEALRSIRRMADDLGDLSQELDATSCIREVTRDIAKEDNSGLYRLPYTSRPDFIGDRWKM